MKVHLLYTRREFLRSGVLVAVSTMMPRFLVDFATAAATGTAGKTSDERVLVVIQLAGGNDALNTVIPYTDESYYMMRPRLGIPRAGLIPVNDAVGFHASLKDLHAMYDRGLVAVVEGVGYPNPNRSHFRSMEIWHTASDSNVVLATGWIGRYLDAACGDSCDPTAALAVGSERPQAFYGRRGLGVAVASPERFAWPQGPDGATRQRFQALNEPSQSPQNHSLDFIRHVMADALISADKIHDVAKRYKGGITYPAWPFASNLRTIASMIAGGLPAKIYFTSLSGFDTHANQLNTHARLLKEFSESTAAFMADLERQHNADRVLIMTFSEFGRRVAENASGGTDHGTAESLFIIGKGIRPGFAGKRPSLSNLDNGDLIFTTDFRSVYATVLEDWLGAASRAVLPREFPKLPLIATPARKS
ncbi:MAG: DUF1501 domain-containing protein [Candidatus Sumerlaeaceae bacterium]